MPTRDASLTTIERARRDPEFAKALLAETVTLIVSGEPETARLLLRDLVNATTGFESLAEETSIPAKSLHRMLSERGNPNMNNLAAILVVVERRIKELIGHATKKVAHKVSFKTR
jgi:DNA-binding phage protein